MNGIINFSNCPSCQNEWKNGLYSPKRCEKCDIEFYYSNSFQAILKYVPSNANEKGFAVVWTKQGCNLEYYLTSPNRYVKVDWLPFDITAEQIRLFLPML